MVNYTELKELKNSKNMIEIRNIKNEYRSHVYYEARNFSYKFVKCRYDNKKRLFNHVEIDDSILDDICQDQIISTAIDKLHQTEDCWSLEGIKNQYEFKKISCDACKSSR